MPSSRSVAAAILLAGSVLASCGTHASPTPPPTPPPTLGATPPPANACTPNIPQDQTVVDEADQAPMCRRGAWVAVLPAMKRPPSPRRSEVYVLSKGRTIVAHAGQTVLHDETILPSLGPTAFEDQQWHVLWQLHGPVGRSWPGPAMGLAVRNGQLRLGGGDGHPDHSYTRRNYEWAQVLEPYRDQTPVHVRIMTHLATDSSGWISVWIDGRQVLDHWVPVSPQGFRPGTIYPGQRWVASRVGLYRGAQGSAAPTTEQSASHVINETWIR